MNVYGIMLFGDEGLLPAASFVKVVGCFISCSLRELPGYYLIHLYYWVTLCKEEYVAIIFTTTASNQITNPLLFSS